MAERILNTWRDPFNAGFSTCRPKQITIQSGITILVGCNGAGKTTLLKNIQLECEKQNIPCHRYDNLTQGGKTSLGNALYNNQMNFVAAAYNSSEGENINLNLIRQFQNFDEFLYTGRIKDRYTKLHDLFTPYETPETNERWLLFDGIDSGHSIDNILEVKDICKDLCKRAEQKGYTLYILISANEYEMAHESKCLDVTNGKYLTFTSYETFKAFILKSREKKNKRNQRIEKKRKYDQSEEKD